MLLVVRSVKHEDVSQCISLRVSNLGSLVIGRPPPYPGYTEKQEELMHKDLDGASHVHHLKVVDTENDTETVAYAKWEVYEHGRPNLEELREPMKKADKEVDQFGLLREAAHDYFCHRNSKMGQHPHLLLAVLVTASQHRRRGAGSLLVQWGTTMSDATGLPCYVQASEQGRRLYRHHGFHNLDTVQFDLTKYGIDGLETMTEMLRNSSAGPKRDTISVTGP